MNLPFTSEQFLRVFQVYNESVWPMQVVLFLLGLFAISFALKRRPNSNRIISAILAFFWLWMGVVYHLINFSTINNAAYVFGILFILQGLLFLYAGVFTPSLSFEYRPDGYGVAGALLLLYAMMVYPVLGHSLGHLYPQSPTFGLPCPTTIFTFGILLWADKKFSFVILVIPLIWSIIGFSAVISLGISEDSGLIVAGLLGTWLVYRRNKFGLQQLTGQGG